MEATLLAKLGANKVSYNLPIRVIYLFLFEDNGLFVNRTCCVVFSNTL